MTLPRAHRRRRGATLLVAAAALGATTASLTACAPDSGARDLAEQYVELVATAGPDDLEALWAMSASESVSARVAGDLLVGATERIEVLEVGAPTEATSASADRLGSDLETWDAVQVSVRYSLDGAEHEGIVVLAPFEDGPRTSPSTWRIVTPLAGELQLPASGFGAVIPDVAVSGEVLAVDHENVEALVPLFPAVYEVQQRTDPYAASPIEQLTVLAGSSTPLPQAVLEPTDETTTTLQAQSDAVFAACTARIFDCPFDIVDEAERLDAIDDWSAELVAAPVVSVEGDAMTVEGGRLTMQTPDGPVTVAFSGTVRWSFDSERLEPAFSFTRLALEVTR